MSQDLRRHRQPGGDTRGTVVVTGSTGFLGRHVVRCLTAVGYNVVGLSRSTMQLDRPTGRYRHLPVDLADPSSVDTVLRAGGERSRAVVHLAAVFPASFTSPDAEECGLRNLRMDDHVVSACERLGVPLVYASTASVYPTDTSQEKGEEGPTENDRPYAREKVSTEHDAMKRLAGSGIPFSALRITAPYGTGQATRTVVRIFLERALKDQPLMYHGSGAREQDFIHASDVADAVLAAITRAATGVYNIGSGAPITMKDLASLIVRAVPGSQSSVEPSGMPDPDEVRFARIPIGKAGAQLDWKPRIALAEGVAHWATVLRGESGDAPRVSV